MSARALILMAAFDLEPLPPWDELPWFKLEQAWYFARWNRIKARAPRAQRFCVEREGSRAALAPGRRVQITLLRHGEGAHNAYAAARIAAGDTRPPFAPARLAELRHLVDAPLNAKGRAEAAANAPAARALAPQPALVVVSPLRRATDTALAAFEHLALAGAAPRAAVVAHDACRESCHCRNVCDMRRRVAAIAADYPFIDYAAVVDPAPSAPPSAAPSAAPSADEEEEDGGAVGLEGETVDSLVERAHGFLCWLFAEPRAGVSVAVGTHSIFLAALTAGVLHFDDEADARARYFETGEMRTLVVRCEEGRPGD